MTERSGTYESTDKVATITTDLQQQLVEAISQAFKKAQSPGAAPLKGTGLDAANKFSEVLARLGMAAETKKTQLDA